MLSSIDSQIQNPWSWLPRTLPFDCTFSHLHPWKLHSFPTPFPAWSSSFPNSYAL